MVTMSYPLALVIYTNVPQLPIFTQSRTGRHPLLPAGSSSFFIDAFYLIRSSTMYTKIHGWRRRDPDIKCKEWDSTIRKTQVFRIVVNEIIGNRLSFRFTVSDVGEFNYIYIPDYRRYYFVESVSLSENGMNVYECECDYLMTYKELINNLSVKCKGSTKKFITNNVIIDRTESNVLITLHCGA